MAQLVVRNLEDEVKQRLRVRAARNGRSMEEEVRAILRDAVGKRGANKDEAKGGLGTEIAALFKEHGLRKGQEIQELRGFPLTPWSFEDC